MTTLRPLTQRNDIAQAVRDLTAQLRTGAIRHAMHTVGFPGGSRACTLFWRPEDGFWFGSAKLRNKRPRKWMIYGTVDPRNRGVVPITAEICSPLQGVDLRTAGCFVRDELGTVYLAHSGKVGGGTKGVGKSAFVAHYKAGNWMDVQLPDGTNRRMMILGAVGTAVLPKLLSKFLGEVDAFKRAVRRGSLPRIPLSARPPASPGFAGKKRYDVNTTIHVNSIHGDIVEALDEELRARAYRTTSDQCRDLVVYGAASILFEIKPEAMTDSIYKAIGQLMFHGASEKKKPALVAVFPDTATAQTKETMARLGIHVLRFKVSGSTISFPGLDPLLESVRES